jgi:hypothetical protein
MAPVDGAGAPLQAPPQELPELLASWKEELQPAGRRSDLAGTGRPPQQPPKAAYLQEARALSRQRAKAAPPAGQGHHRSHAGLGMEGGRFEVQVTPKAANPACRMAWRTSSFWWQAIAGSTPRPVGKVASGGELSRIALAIAVTTSELGTAQTLIFDEVDAGVGGAVAAGRGPLMRQLGRTARCWPSPTCHRWPPAPTTTWWCPSSCSGHHLSSVAAVRASTRVRDCAHAGRRHACPGTTLAHAKEMLELHHDTPPLNMDLELVLITGMSGSGKSVALHALEDAGYYCVDNLPPELLLPFVALEQERKATRWPSPWMCAVPPRCRWCPNACGTARQGVVIKPIFLDATTDTLVRRFSETRRKHPLSQP